MFSKTGEYAIKIMIYLSIYSDKLHQIKEISDAIKSPEPFTAKILQQLAKVELLHSMKGKNGGFTLGKKTNEIKIQDIIIAVDGSKSINQCILGLKKCSEKNPCPLHHKFYNIKAQIQTNILDVSLEELKRNLNQITLY